MDWPPNIGRDGRQQLVEAIGCWPAGGAGEIAAGLGSRNCATCAEKGSRLRAGAWQSDHQH